MVLGCRVARGEWLVSAMGERHRGMAAMVNGESLGPRRSARAKCLVRAARVHGRKGIDDECPH